MSKGLQDLLIETNQKIAVYLAQPEKRRRKRKARATYHGLVRRRERLGKLLRG